MQTASAVGYSGFTSSGSLTHPLTKMLSSLFSRTHATPRSYAPKADAFSSELTSLITRSDRLSDDAAALEDSTLRHLAMTGSEVFSSPAEEYAREKLCELVSLPVGWDGENAPPVSEAARKRMLRLIRAVSEEASVFPTLVTDFQGGVSAEWRAGKQKAAIEVDSEGMAFLYMTDPEGEEMIADELPLRHDVYEKIRIFRRQLNVMSIRVEAVNPRWRSLFE